MDRTRASAFCRRAEDAVVARAPSEGFTLVELMVVLAILGGLVAVAFPGIVRLYASVRGAFEQDDLRRQLLVLPEYVRDSGQGGILIGTSEEDLKTARELTAKKPGVEEWPVLRIALPAGWSMAVPKPIYYHFTGMCEGGEVSFTYPPVTYTYQLTAPLCRPLPANAANN